MMGWEAAVSAVDSGGAIAVDRLKYCTPRGISRLALVDTMYMFAVVAGYRGDRTLNVVDFLTVLRATGPSRAVFRPSPQD